MQSLDTGSSYFWINFNVGGTRHNGVLFSTNRFTADVTYVPFAASIILDLDANDTVHLDHYQSGGTQQTDMSTTSHWGGYLIA